MGLTDRQCRLCFAFAFWNGEDKFLKERLYGLTGPQGNNGEDVKECYYYLDGLPTHSLLKMLYKYPQREFPYETLLTESLKRQRGERELELIDTGIFANNRYFDLEVTYLKASADDILIQLKINNRALSVAPLRVLPQLWYRNTWSWGRTGEAYLQEAPRLHLTKEGCISGIHPSLGEVAFYAGSDTEALFTENETNMERLFQFKNGHPYVKDSFHDYIVHGKKNVVNPNQIGSKAAYHYNLNIPPEGEVKLFFRLVNREAASKIYSGEFAEELPKVFPALLAQREEEANLFYGEIIPHPRESEEYRIARQAYAGLIWTKQFYYYSVKEWLEGDPTQPAPDPGRRLRRNRTWAHLYNRDIISMPDKWEYPWYAAWDLAFHMISFARIDPNFAKEQLLLFLREWFMQPNGQMPAYEFAFSDVNPPVHAWACFRVYKIANERGERDHTFLARAFHKLLLNFTWWVNQKDIEGNNLFTGGFLGLDNIGVFDRSAPLPVSGHLEQADATAWMAFYCGTMLSMALELSRFDPSYSDVASKFFEHFVSITNAINHFAGPGLWDQLDGFYYDQLSVAGHATPLRVRSLVGLLPLIAVEVLDHSLLQTIPDFKKRMDWFIQNQKELSQHISFASRGEMSAGISLLAIPSRERLERMLRYLFDEEEFLAPYGIRSLSRIHEKYPYVFQIEQNRYIVEYNAGESKTSMFGGNSNWRGPVWFPINYLIVEALERYYYFYQETLLVEVPRGSGNRVNLLQAAKLLSERLVKLFTPTTQSGRPINFGCPLYKDDPNFRDLVLFYEFFDGDTGRGLGASHQTGWTALVTRFLEKSAK
jgi:hypothetical protein